MLVGDRDPLHDECVRFAYRLHAVGGNVHLAIFEEFPHGFLSMDWKLNLLSELKSETRRAVRWAGEALVDLANIAVSSPPRNSFSSGPN